MAAIMGFGRLGMILFFVTLASVALGFTDGGTYTIFYPAAKKYLSVPSHGSVTYVTTPTSLVVRKVGSNYSLTEKGNAFSGFPTSFYVEAPQKPGSRQYFVMTPVATTSISSTDFVETIAAAKKSVVNIFDPLSSAINNQKMALTVAQKALKEIALGIEGFSEKLPWE